MNEINYPIFERKNANIYMKNLINTFLTYFQEMSYIKHEPVKISSGIDKSVRFIGSHISVLKPYFLNDKIPSEGYVMSQPCIRTRNLKKYEEDENFYPNWGSYFPSLGILVKPENLEIAIQQTYDFLQKKLNINPIDLKILINSQDNDLMNIAKKTFEYKMLEIDTMPLNYYRHKLGIDGVWGRNFNLALRNFGKDTFSDIGNVIILENKDKQLGIEIALGSSTILKEIYGLNHVLDCHPIIGLEEYIKDSKQRIKLEDTIVTSMALYNDNLIPSNKTTPSRLMKKYLEVMMNTISKTKISPETIRDILYNYEILEYGKSNKYTEQILDFIYKEHSNENNKTVQNMLINFKSR